jgi:hypothetical protein
MPPVLGWAAVTGQAPGEAWLLFLIIFVWTPPHFWSLALYRADEYADGQSADAAGGAWPGIHPTQHLRLYPRPRPGDADALRHRHERLALSRRGAGARRDLHRPRVAPLAPLQRPHGAGHLPLVDLVPVLLFAALLVDHYLPY